MRRLLALVAVLLPSFALAADPPAVLPLWPGPVPGEKPGDLPEEAEVPTKAGQLPVKRITNVTKPTITIYRPAKENTGTAIVIAPGGGYNILAWEHEGTQVAEWLSSIGVTGVLLKYRVPRRPDQPKDAPPIGALQDAQRAVRLTRSKAKEWGVDPNRVGMLGFSAGGHLAVWTGTNPDKPSYQPVDEADKLSARPDFLIPIYPGGLLDRTHKDQFRPEIRISKDTPPAFLVVASDDKGSLASTLRCYQALNEAGVRAELHIYASGGHGFGMRSADKPYATWPKRCEEWLRSEGWLTARK